MNNVLLTPPSGLSQWLQLYALYRVSFPRAERKPFSVILSAYRKGRTDVWCILEGNRFLGFAATMNSPRLVMLDYLAISKKHRSQGIGTAAMHELMQRYGDRELILEIESPYEPGPDQERRQKRKQFYVNCGMRPLNVMAEVFGVKMELLGQNCEIDFQRYRSFYHDFYNPCSARHILPAGHPESGQ